MYSFNHAEEFRPSATPPSQPHPPFSGFLFHLPFCASHSPSHTPLGPRIVQTGFGLCAGNLLKPMLGRGELRCIGATTLDEYRKYIEKDPALERRFQQVYVDQPSVTSTIAILRGLRERCSSSHFILLSSWAGVKGYMHLGSSWHSGSSNSSHVHFSSLAFGFAQWSHLLSVGHACYVVVMFWYQNDSGLEAGCSFLSVQCQSSPMLCDCPCIARHSSLQRLYPPRPPSPRHPPRPPCTS